MNLTGTELLMRSNYTTNPLSIRDKKNPSAYLMGKKKLDNPGLSYFGSRSYWLNNEKHLGYKGHEYDLFEYSRIIDTEAMVAKAFERKRSLIFKNGYFFESDNKDNIEYIESRIREIEYTTGKTFRSFVEEMAYNLVMFHNAYIAIIRDEDHSTGMTYEDGNKELEPIAGWFNLPTESIQRKIKPNGTISMYRQYIDANNFVMFKPDKIKHLKYNARGGFTIGTPPLEAVKDDILALRRIEESVETLIYKGLFPMIHVRVGTENRPATVMRDGTDEVQAMNRIMQELDDYGGVTTNERVEIKAIGAESLALRAEAYLEYFKDRVMLGLGVSDIDMGVGDSSGKATGQIISQTLKEAVINMQGTIADFITHSLFAPLLVESGRYKASYEIKSGDMVKFRFNHVDQEAQVKLESHVLNLYNSGLISFNEARKEIGYKELSDREIRHIGKEKELITPTHEVESTKVATEAAALSTKAAAASTSTTKTANSSGNTTKAQGSAKAAQSKTSPKNQFSDSLALTREDILIVQDNHELLELTIVDYLKSILDTDNLCNDNIVSNLGKIASSRIAHLRDSGQEFTEEEFNSLLVEICEPLEDLI